MSLSRSLIICLIAGISLVATARDRDSDNRKGSSKSSSTRQSSQKREAPRQEKRPEAKPQPQREQKSQRKEQSTRQQPTKQQPTRKAPVTRDAPRREDTRKASPKQTSRNNDARQQQQRRSDEERRNAKLRLKQQQPTRQAPITRDQDTRQNDTRGNQPQPAPQVIRPNEPTRQAPIRHDNNNNNQNGNQDGRGGDRYNIRIDDRGGAQQAQVQPAPQPGNDRRTGSTPSYSYKSRSIDRRGEPTRMAPIRHEDRDRGQSNANGGDGRGGNGNGNGNGGNHGGGNHNGGASNGHGNAGWSSSGGHHGNGHGNSGGGRDRDHNGSGWSDRHRERRSEHDHHKTKFRKYFERDRHDHRRTNRRWNVNINYFNYYSSIDSYIYPSLDVVAYPPYAWFDSAVYIEQPRAEFYCNRYWYRPRAVYYREPATSFYFFVNLGDYAQRGVPVYVRDAYVNTRWTHADVFESTDWQGIAYARFAEGNYAASINAFSNALSRDRYNGPLYFGRAQAYFAAGMIYEASADLATGLRLVPDWPDVKMSLFELYDNPQDLDGQLNRLESWVEANPGSPEGHFVLGYMYYFTQWYDAADDELRYALAIEPGNGPALRLLDAIAARRKN